MSIRKLILTGLALFIGSMGPFAGIKDDIAKTIVRLRSGNKYSTAFFWKDGQSLVATLHGIADQSDTEVYLPITGRWVKATPIRVLKGADLVMLKISRQTSEHFISNQYTERPSTDTRAFTVGYNGGNTTYQDRDFTVGLLQGNRLQDLLPAPVERQIRNLGFPSLQTEIVYLKGQLLHGFSGAPVVDFEGKLVGVADGGLENGASGVSWCISASLLSQLENSGEAFPAIDTRQVNILFATEELAQSTLHKLRAGDILFEELATQLSACSETREKGGEIGWVSVTDSASSLDASAILDEAHLDPLLPSAARETVIQITTKPGDIISVQSERGFHLVQVVDIMADVRKMASIRKPRAKRTEHQPPDKLTGVLSGALNNDNVDLTYKLETMGCQMNMADSERIEGQLQALGIRPFDEDVNENSKKGPDVIVLNTCRYVKDSKSVRKSLLCNR